MKKDNMKKTNTFLVSLSVLFLHAGSAIGELTDTTLHGVR